MTSTPLISVVIPTFNRAYCLGATLQSVLAQTVSDLEVIVVDDGSTDGTLALLKTFGERIKVVQQKNTGVSAARNAGVKAARGKWIAFQDSDDLWLPEKLAKQLAALQKNGGRWCATLAVDEKGKPAAQFGGVVGKEISPKIFFSPSAELIELVGCAHPALQSMMLEKELIQEAGLFDEELVAAEDTEFIFRLSLLAGMYFLNEPLVIISEATSDSLTRSVDPVRRERRFDSYLVAQRKIHRQLVARGAARQVFVRHLIAYFALSRAELACVAGEFSRARSFAADSIRCGGLRNAIRCAAIWCAPSMQQERLKRKWHGQSV